MSVPQRDLKQVKRPPSSMIRLLRKGKIFSVCFVVDRRRRFFNDAADLRNGLELSIGMMERWENASSCEYYISKMRELREEVGKKSVNINLISNIILASLFGAFIAYIISKYSKPQAIAWIPDRDKITDSYRNIAHALFAINAASFCQRLGINAPPLHIFTQENDNLWCDPFIRVADYVAGAAAAWDPPAYDAVPLKIALMIRGAFCENRYLGLFRVAFSITPDNRFACRVSRIDIGAPRKNGPRFPKGMKKTKRKFQRNSHSVRKCSGTSNGIGTRGCNGNSSRQWRRTVDRAASLRPTSGIRCDPRTAHPE